MLIERAFPERPFPVPPLAGTVAGAVEGRDERGSSLLFTLPDSPGALAGVLNCLAAADINLRKIESRPLRNTAPAEAAGGAAEKQAAGHWKYAFFVDVERDMETEENAKTLYRLRTLCSSCRLLGTYARGPELETAIPD